MLALTTFTREMLFIKNSSLIISISKTIKFLKSVISTILMPSLPKCPKIVVLAGLLNTGHQNRDKSTIAPTKEENKEATSLL